MNPATAAAVHSAVANSFVAGFRLMMWMCAALSLAGAALAWVMIPQKVVPVRSADSQHASLSGAHL